jgi:hypothetical protein
MATTVASAPPWRTITQCGASAYHRLVVGTTIALPPNMQNTKAGHGRPHQNGTPQGALLAMVAMVNAQITANLVCRAISGLRNPVRY